MKKNMIGKVALIILIVTMVFSYSSTVLAAEKVNLLTEVEKTDAFENLSAGKLKMQDYLNSNDSPIYSEENKAYFIKDDELVSVEIVDICKR